MAKAAVGGRRGSEGARNDASMSPSERSWREARAESEERKKKSREGGRRLGV